MRQCVVLAAAVLVTTFCFAQVEDPVKWKLSSKKIDATTYEIHLTATIEDGWHVYSQSTPSGGPVPTSIEFTKNPLITIQGDAREVGKLEKHFEPLFGLEVMQFSNKVTFVQTVKLKGNVKTSLTGIIQFMTCNDEQCLPPSKEKFSIVLN